MQVSWSIITSYLIRVSPRRRPPSDRGVPGGGAGGVPNAPPSIASTSSYARFSSGARAVTVVTAVDGNATDKQGTAGNADRVIATQAIECQGIGTRGTDGELAVEKNVSAGIQGYRVVSDSPIHDQRIDCGTTRVGYGNRSEPARAEIE